jgi:nucleotide-binding universal stress UspA family protein
LTWEEHKAQEIARPTNVCSEYLAGVQKRLEDLGLRAQSVVLQGKPAEEIADYANDNPVNLIMMSTHGRSGISRWAYGSVADKVLLGVCSPVFIVRPSPDTKTAPPSAEPTC